MSASIPFAPLGAAALVVAAAAAVAGPGPRETSLLAQAAGVSGRPKECAGSSAGGERAWRPGLWDLAREPGLRRYCDLLARAHAKLASSPAAAREAASVADQVLPGHAAPWVVRARAGVRLRDWGDAVQSFERARSLDPRALEEPQSLRDLASALRRAGRAPEALATYRVLVPRLALLPTLLERIEVLAEAASLAMAGGAGGLDESAAFLGEARNLPPTRYDAEIAALLALALDRAGNREQAGAVLVGLARGALPVAASPVEQVPPEYLADPADAFAMAALVLERSEPRRAATWWERYLADAKAGPWTEHARRHLEAARAAGPGKAPAVAAPARPAAAGRAPR